MSSTSPPNRVASPKQMLSDGNCITNAGSNSSKLKCNGPQSDPRSDLLKAIRDGNIMKIEAFQKLGLITRNYLANRNAFFCFQA